MGVNWLLHNSHDSFYRSPFGAVAGGSEVNLRFTVGSGTSPDWVNVSLWQHGHEEIIPMTLWRSETESRIYEAKIRVSAVPGLAWYYFTLGLRGKTYYYGNNPQMLGGFGQIWDHSPASYQITVFRPDAKTPDWFKESIMYQVFVDRFFNGHEDGRIENLRPGSLVHPFWDDTPFYVRDMRSGAIFAYDFFGGNIKGLLAKLEYLQELNVGSIYLNPVFESPSNHKYDTSDYKKIDPMFGDNELFREFCIRASDKGMHVILDGVFSHTGSDSKYFNIEGNYEDLGAYQSPESPYYRWYRFSEYPDKYESWWGIGTLPNVNELEPSYVNFIIDGEDSVIRFWHKMGVKGWRLDVADELPDEFIKHLRSVLKEQDSESVLIGEVWEDASRKESYGHTREYLLGDELDSVTNYPFRNILLDFMLYRKSPAETQAALLSIYENYPKENFYALMNLLGGHDVPRVLTMLGEAPPPDSMSIIDQARYRLPPEKRLLAINRLKLLVLWQMTFPGVPCIYYGDEAGMEGYTDPFNRGTYPWGNEDRQLLDWYKKIIALRKKYAVLQTGEWHSIPVGGDIYGYLRRIENSRDVFESPRKNNVAILLINRSKDNGAVYSADIGKFCQEELIDVLDGGKTVRLAGGLLEITLKPLEGKLLLARDEKDPAFSRGSGILLHPTSLPSKYGIGDFGENARGFLDFLAQSEQKYWQLLPLNPPGYGGSPYACASAFAGNHLLISPEELVEEGLLTPLDILHPPPFEADRVDYRLVAEYKEKLLRKAYYNFSSFKKTDSLAAFCGENAVWLKNYSLFMALKQHYHGRAWTQWDRAAAEREPETLRRFEQSAADEISYQNFLQYTFYKQWQELKRYAVGKNIKIIGDLPIFVAHDSCDVWANRELFELDEKGLPLKVAGVPPDYFSKTGQLWGNPHYDWQAMYQDDYRWWRKRFQMLFKIVDIVRIDHFRGFEGYWEVPASEETAENGRWVKGPGKRFFSSIERFIGKLPVIAEDLGVITPSVVKLREKFNFPGMKVLQFAFDDKGRFLADDCEDNMVVYTGTHDNDTSLGWYESMTVSPEFAAGINKCLKINSTSSANDFCWNFIELAYANKACLAIIPLQDVLCQGEEARFNLPGTTDGNWQWRFAPGALNPQISGRLAGLVAKYNRQNA